MPLDPSIPLSGRPVEVQNPLETLSTIAQIHGIREAAELRREAAEEARRKRRREEAYEQALQESMTLDPQTGQPKVDYTKLLGNVPAPVILDIEKALGEHAERMTRVQTSNLTLEQKKAEYFGGLARTVAAAQYNPTAFGVAITTARKAGAMTAAQADEILAAVEQDPTQIKAFTDAAIAQVTEPTKPEAFTLNPGDVRYDPTGKVMARGEAKPVEHSPIYKEWQDHLASGGTLSFDAFREQDANLRKPTVNVNAATQDDIEDAVDAMIAGKAPPILPGRATTAYLRFIAVASRKGYDLARAATDWQATQAHVRTLNNAQQTRLRQAIGQLPELLDSVEDLAHKWKGGRFPPLNRVNLVAAKNGAYGPEAASIANQLDAQIADVTADLGAVYMGGNSPTDHALELAGKALNAEWSEKVLLDMVALARKNVQYRLNSVNNVEVAGDSPTNPYAPPVVTGPKEGDVKPIPGFPGTEQTYRNGKWIRTK